MCNNFRYSSLSGQALRFVFVGGLNTVVSYGLYILLLSWLGYQLAYAVAYVTGIVFSYFLNAKAVFKVRTSLFKLFLFSLVYVLQLGGGTALMYVLIDRLELPKEFAPLAVLLIMVPISFFLVRTVMRLTFHKESRFATSDGDTNLHTLDKNSSAVSKKKNEG